MKLLKIKTLLWLISMTTILLGQLHAQTISGYVIDKQTRLPLEGAVLYVSSTNESEYFETNRDGFFSIELGAGMYNLSCTKSGYETLTIRNIRLERNQVLVQDIEMQSITREPATPAPQTGPSRQPAPERTAPREHSDKPQRSSRTERTRQALSSYGHQSMQEGIGLRAGINLVNIKQSFQRSSWEFKTKWLFAYHLGIVYNHPTGISHHTYLQAGLLYHKKGFAFDINEYKDSPDEKISGHHRYILHYAEVPINIIYPVGDFYLLAGPYIGIGIGGKMKWDLRWNYQGNEDSESGSINLKPVFGQVDESFDFRNSEPYRGLDFGLNLGVAYQYGPLLYHLGFGYGLGNLTPKYKDDNFDPRHYKMSNRVINFSAIYSL